MEIYRWHEQESHKHLYEAEIGVLKRGLSGDFSLVKLFEPSEKDGRITAVGSLTYYGNKTQDILITFPTKYPYASPKIIAVTINTDKEKKLIEPLQPFHFGKGNQYNDGALCLLRREEWNKEQHNIGWLLRRAQKWLISATSNEGFKPEEIVEELQAPIPHIGQVLLPKDYELPKNTKTGQFLLTQFKPNHYILEYNFLASSPFTLNTGIEVFKWYSFDKGILFKDLFSGPDPLVFLNVFNKHFGENLLNENTAKNIGIHLPDDPNPWHFFKLSILQNGNKVKLNISYLIARNIDKELYLRTKDIFDDKILSQKSVTIIGLGALGSEVARSLARNGIGHFNLFDNDTFEIGNSVRHAADLFYIGEDKVGVAKQLILRSNPNITVNTYIVDVLDDNGLLEKSLAESDLCIVLTAEESVDFLINDKYIPRYDFPFIFARVSAGGMSGVVQVVQHKKTACLRCLGLGNVDKLPKPKGKVVFDELPPEYGSCSSPAVPGSEIDTKEVALQVSRVSLQNLFANKKSVYPKSLGNQYYWHGPLGSKDKAPFTWEIKNIRKHPDCESCNQ